MDKNIEIQDIINNKYNDFSLEEKKLIHYLYHKSKSERSELYEKLRNVVFRLNPPTPAEYLDPRNEWITKPFADSIYPYIKEDFLEILNPDKNYTQVVEYGATRLGKSFLVRLLIHYIVIYLHCLRHPQLYYNLSPTTNLSIYIMSFVTEKVNQLLLKPIYDIFDMSPRMKKIKFQDKVAEEQYKIGLDNIVWSKASTFGHLTLESKVSLNVGTDPLSFIGSDLLFLSVSEIGFFIQQAGTTHEEIFQLYSDGLDRIKATVGNNYLGMIYLDTSANDQENPIEKYINNDLRKDKNVFFRQRSRWEARPHMFPKWKKTKETFKVFIGNANKPMKIISKELELKTLPKQLIIDVPIDCRDEFKRNLNKSIKDIAGIPTVRENIFIDDHTLIDNIFDNEILSNIESGLIIDAASEPKGLIWNKINNLFFSKIEIKDNKEIPDISYKIKRAINEPRFIGLDQAHSNKGDIYGMAMLHKEWSKVRGCVIYISDFCFVLLPGKTGINLSATEEFIVDLKQKGNIYIINISTDTFQSATIKQNLKRREIEVISQSVDKTLDGYQLTYSHILQGTMKCGRNIFLKNNLKSLSREKNDRGNEIIDHTSGTTYNDYFGDWESSLCGVNAKDASDALTQALWSAEKDDSIPSTIYEDENRRHSIKEEDIQYSIKGAYDKIKLSTKIFVNTSKEKIQIFKPLFTNK